MSTSRIEGNRWSASFNGTQWILRYYEGPRRRTHRVPLQIQKRSDAEKYCLPFVAAMLRVDKGTGEPPLTKRREINPRITFQQLGELWTTGELHRMFPHRIGEKKTSHSDASRLENHVYPVLGNIQVRAFEGAQAVEWAEDVLQRLPSELGRSARQVAQLVNRLLTIAAFPGIRLIPSNPLPRGYVPPTPPRKAKSYLYPEEDALLMANTSISLKLRVFFGLSIREGGRLSNFLELQFAELDLERGIIRLDETKTGKPISWVLDEGTTEGLRRYRDQYVLPSSPQDHVFLDADGKLRVDGDVLHKTKLAKTLRGLLTKSGVERPELFEHNDNRLNFRAHDLRTSFVTTKLAMGKSETWVMDRTGHESSQMIANYRQKARSHVEADLGDYVPLCAAVPELAPKKEPRKLAEHSAVELSDAEQTDLFGGDPPGPKRHPWAWLIKRVFLVDVTDCPDCGGRMKWREVCTEASDIHRVLAASGLAPRAPPSTLTTPSLTRHPYRTRQSALAS